jgi:pimeloyl-ACP methyl ester carboxylesterase
VRTEPVLLLHGQPGGARDWERVRCALAPHARTIVIDRPGWDGTRPPADLAGNAAAALAALDAHGVARATIVGHSLGAAVAAWLAATHSDRVGALVLVAPAANLASLYRLDYLLATPVLGFAASAAALAGLGLALTARPVRRLASSAAALDERYLQAAARLLRRPATWRSYVAEQRTLIRDLPGLEERLAHIPVPTKIVVGGEDRIIPISSARRLAEQIPKAELVQIERAGHLVPQQQAAHLAQIIAAVG